MLQLVKALGAAAACYPRAFTRNTALLVTDVQYAVVCHAVHAGPICSTLARWVESLAPKVCCKLCCNKNPLPLLNNELFFSFFLLSLAFSLLPLPFFQVGRKATGRITISSASVGKKNIEKIPPRQIFLLLLLLRFFF